MTSKEIDDSLHPLLLALIKIIAELQKWLAREDQGEKMLEFRVASLNTNSTRS